MTHTTTIFALPAISSRPLTLLPPAPDRCPVCATKHAPDQPHNATSIYYQIAFYQEHRREVTWADAMQHCTPAMQAAWREQLQKRGIDVPEVAPCPQ